MMNVEFIILTIDRIDPKRNNAAKSYFGAKPSKTSKHSKS
jgi:hypothetical protein